MLACSILNPDITEHDRNPKFCEICSSSALLVTTPYRGPGETHRAGLPQQATYVLFLIDPATRIKDYFKGSSEKLYIYRVRLWRHLESSSSRTAIWISLSTNLFKLRIFHDICEPFVLTPLHPARDLPQCLEPQFG